jgi:hypothetical protein
MEGKEADMENTQKWFVENGINIKILGRGNEIRNGSEND